MKRLIYNLLLAVSCLLVSESAIASKSEAKRTEHFEYDVDKSIVFELVNKYGNIIIENVSTDQLTVEVTIKTEARKMQDCEKNLAKIRIADSKVGEKIILQTELLGDIDDSYSVNYNIKMPAYLNLNLLNKYGNVEADCLFGKTNLKVSYGSLIINKIKDETGGFPTIDLSYATKSIINDIEIGGISLAYSNVNVVGGRSVAIAAKYSNLTIGKISSLAIESAYDNLSIEEVSKADINSRYTNVQIDKLNEFAQITIKYGDIKMIGLASESRGVDIDAKYTDVKINVANLKMENYDLNLETKYGSINSPKFVTNGTVSSNGDESSVYRTSGDNKSKIKVISKYGDIRLIE